MVLNDSNFFLLESEVKSTSGLADEVGNCARVTTSTTWDDIKLTNATTIFEIPPPRTLLLLLSLAQRLTMRNRDVRIRREI